MEGLEPVKSTATSNTYDVGDGLRVTELSAEPINVRDADGSWTPISTEVTPGEDGHLEVADNPLNPVFAEGADDRGVLQVSDGAHSLTFTLLDAVAGSTGSVESSVVEGDQSAVVYGDAVAPGADLVYDVGRTSVKETIRLAAPPAASESKWTWLVEGPGLALTQEDGELLFKLPGGSTKFRIPAPIMWDSSAVAGVREAAEAPVDTEILETSPGHWSVTLSAEPAWLNDPERVYPVFVDPTIALGDSNVKSYKSDGAIRTDYVHVGNSRDANTDKYWRAFVWYDYSSLYGKQVLDAQITAATRAGTTTARTGYVNTADAGCTGYYCVDVKLASLAIDTDGATSASNETLPAQISSWVNARVARPLILRGAETSGAYTYKQLDTVLRIAWKDFPKVTSALAPSPTSTAPSYLDPTFKVAYSDPNGTGVRTRYEVSATSDFANVVADSGWETPGPHTLNPGLLAPNTTYFWRVQITDNQDGIFGTSAQRYSPTWSFTTGSTLAPALPNTPPGDGATLHPMTTTAFDSAEIGQPIAANSTATIQISGIGDLPEVGSGITAAAIDVTLLPSATSGEVTAYSTDQTSGLRVSAFTASTPTRSGRFVVPIGTDGAIILANSSAGAVNFIVEVEGWFEGIAAPTISCPNGIQDGTWEAEPPTDDFVCRITAPPAPSGTGYFTYAVDGVATEYVDLSATDPTAVDVVVPAGAADHHIRAVVYADAASPSNQSDVSFGFGEWEDANLNPSVPDGGFTESLEPTLFATTDGAPLPDELLARYTLELANDPTSTPLVSDWVSAPLTLESSPLIAGEVYRWKVELRGPSSTDQSLSSSSSPWWTFTALDQAGTEPALGATRPSDPRCQSVLIIAVRGTSEAAGAARTSPSPYAYQGFRLSGNTFRLPPKQWAGFGRVLWSHVKSIADDKSRSYYVESIAYPASARLAESVAVGLDVLRNELRSVNRACGSGTAVVVIGYSQGAEVVAHAFSGWRDPATNRVKSAILLADLTFHSTDAINDPTSGPANGFRSHLRAAGSLDLFRVDGTVGRVFSSYCYASDVFCQGNLFGADPAMKVHESYGNSATKKAVWSTILADLKQAGR